MVPPPPLRRAAQERRRAGGRGRCRGTPPPCPPGRSAPAARPGCRDRRSGPRFSISTWVAQPFHLRHVVARRAGWCSRSPPGSAPARCAPSRRCRGRGWRWARRAAAAPGRLISALASATRVFCPAESCPAGRCEQVGEVEFGGKLGDPRARAAARRTDGRRPAGSPPPSAAPAGRRRARRNSSAPGRRTGRAPCRGRARGWCPAVGISRPSSMAMVVVLPAPLPPSRPSVAPAGDGEVDPVHRQRGRRSAWSGPRPGWRPCASICRRGAAGPRGRGAEQPRRVPPGGAAVSRPVACRRCARRDRRVTPSPAPRRPGPERSSTGRAAGSPAASARLPSRRRRARGGCP